VVVFLGDFIITDLEGPFEAALLDDVFHRQVPLRCAVTLPILKVNIVL